MTIVNDDSRVVNKLETSLTGDARVVIYDRHVFLVQATVYSIGHRCNSRSFGVDQIIFHPCVNFDVLIRNNLTVVVIELQH